MSWYDFLKRLTGRKTPPGAEELVDSFAGMLGYRFNSPALLVEALTHRSYVRVENLEGRSNERLEYLGDSVLGVLIAEHLFKSYPDYNEGDLTKTKAMLVNEITLSMVGRTSGLNGFIFLSEDEELAGGRDRHSIVSDALEAVIGAIFLDGGLERAREFIHRIIVPHADAVLSDSRYRNYKGELLEYLQARGQGTPYYEVLAENGPDHAKEFKVGVFTDGTMTGVGLGPSKKDAEQKAAANSLRSLVGPDSPEKEGLKED